MKEVKGVVQESVKAEVSYDELAKETSLLKETIMPGVLYEATAKDAGGEIKAVRVYEFKPKVSLSLAQIRSAK